MIFKYLVLPGYVASHRDNDRHFITAERLMKLYKVDPMDCLVAYEYDGTGKYYGIDVSNLIKLRPQHSGNYKLPDKK